MSTKKKVLLALGGAVGTVLLALLIVPLFFVDQIEARVRSEIEASTRLRVSWSDVGLSFFRNFPHPTVSLSGLTAVGTERFEGDTLAAVDHFRLALDGTTVLGALRGTRSLVVRSVDIDGPTLRLQVDEEGIRSWDVMSEREPASRGEEGGMAVSLRRLDLTGGDVLLDNRASGLFLAVEGLTHELRGDFSRSSLVAETSTAADAVTVVFAGAPYLGGVRLDFDAGFEVDMTEQRARLVENRLRLNDLEVRLDGTIARAEEALALDLTFDAPSTEFGQLLSLVPLMYQRDFASLETAGTFSLAGRVDGEYGPTSVPSFALDLDVRDGSFRYPDLALPARAITVDLSVTNPGGDLDSTLVSLEGFHVEIDGQPIDAAMTLRTPVSDPDADVRVEGVLDMGALARTVKLDNAQELAGVVEANASARARRSDVEARRYDRIAAEGTIAARGLTLRGEGLRQPVDIREADLRLTPRAAELTWLDAQLGSSDMQASGRLDNLLGYALGQETLQGALRFSSRRFVVDEWRSGNALSAIPVPAVFDLTLDGTIDEVVFNGMSFTEARGRAVVRDQRLSLEAVSLSGLGGRIGMDGFYETLADQAPAFSMDLVLDSLDIAASAALTTVQALAPVAPYARGAYSSAIRLSGSLGQNMAPVLEALDGDGSVSTSRVAIEGFPLLVRLSESLQLQRLASPAVGAVRSNIQIRGGRLHVEPFEVNVAGLSMTVAGSNGIDRSLDYTLGLLVPRAGFADAALTSLASRAGPLGASLAATDPVRVGVRVTGSVTDPNVGVSLAETSSAARGAAQQAVDAQVGQRVDEARQRLDAEEEQARQRARAQADSIVAQAQRQADAIRAEAATAADRVRAEGERAAQEVLARANNPVARAAAQPVADRLRREAEERATAIEREADERATALVAEAQARATALIGGQP